MAKKVRSNTTSSARSEGAALARSSALALVVALSAVLAFASLASSEGQAPSWCNLESSQLGEDSKATCRSFGFTYDDSSDSGSQDYVNPAAPSWCNLEPSQLGPDSKETCRGFGYTFGPENEAPVQPVVDVTPTTQLVTAAAVVTPTSAPPTSVAPTTAPPATTTTTAPAARVVTPEVEPVEVPVAAPVAPPTTATPVTIPPTTAPPTTTPPTTTPPTTAPPVVAAPAAGKQVVVIDPGHGAIRQSNGDFAFQRPRAANGLVEDEVALDISRRVEQLLTASGPYDTRMTREDYRAPFAPTGCSVPCLTDLRQRREWAEAQDADLLLSIHLNAFSDPDANGTETYRFSSASSSERVEARERLLADRINDNLVALGLKDRGVKANSGWSVIRSSRFPSLLVEVGFITGSEDGRKFTDPAFRDRVAEAIVAAVVATP